MIFTYAQSLWMSSATFMELITNSPWLVVCVTPENSLAYIPADLKNNEQKSTNALVWSSTCAGEKWKAFFLASSLKLLWCKYEEETGPLLQVLREGGGESWRLQCKCQRRKDLQSQSQWKHDPSFARCWRIKELFLLPPPPPNVRLSAGFAPSSSGERQEVWLASEFD